jgi:hypothetical protein
MIDPFSKNEAPRNSLVAIDMSAKIRWRIKGNDDGHVYQGNVLHVSCKTCGQPPKTQILLIKENPDNSHDLPIII